MSKDEKDGDGSQLHAESFLFVGRSPETVVIIVFSQKDKNIYVQMGGSWLLPQLRVLWFIMKNAANAQEVPWLVPK